MTTTSLHTMGATLTATWIWRREVNSGFHSCSARAADVEKSLYLNCILMVVMLLMMMMIMMIMITTTTATAVIIIMTTTTTTPMMMMSSSK